MCINLQQKNPMPQKLQTHSFCASVLKPGEVWTSAICASALGDPYVTLCDLAVAVVPKSFHFAVILTVDCGISRRAEISQIVLLQWWLPIISPHLKFSKLFTTTHSQLFVKADCIARCWNSKTQVIWPNTFAHTVYMLLKTKDSCIL